MAAVVEKVHTGETPAGGSFLFSEVGATQVVAPEGFSEEQRLYQKTAYQFSPRAGAPRRPTGSRRRTTRCSASCSRRRASSAC